MNTHSEDEPDLESQRDKIIGLGELSIRKSYYPELQQQQEALKQSEARLLSILHASPVMQFVIDQDHRVISWNRAIESYSGIKAEEILGTDGQWKAFYQQKRPVLADILLDQSLHLLPELYPENFSRSRFVENGYEVIRFFPKMGETGKWLHATAVPIRDTKGTIIGAIETLEDITEQKNAEETLRASEERYRHIFNKAPLGFMQYDKEGTILDCNEEFADIMGAPRDRLIGFNTLQGLKDGPARDALITALETGTGYFEGPYISVTGGKKVTMRALHQRLNDHQGNCIGAISVFEDITERMRTQDALQESEKFLNNVVENIPDMIFVKDARDLRFVRFNRAGEELLGLSREELYGKNDHDFFPKDEADFFTKNDRLVLKNRQIVDIPEEKIRTRLKGERILHTKKISIPDETGDPAFLMGISEDITERKQREEEVENARKRLDGTLKLIETIISAIPIPFFYKDRQGRYIGVNNAFAEFMGFTPDFYKGKTVMELWPNEYADVYHAKDLELMKNPQRQIYEFKVVDKNGVEHPVIYTKDVFRDETGQIAGIVGAFIDITERKRMENALQLARNKINLLNTLTFQDIQNTVFSLSAYHELLRMLVTDEKAKSYLEKQKSLNRRIVDILNFAKNYQDMGTKPPRWQNVHQTFLLAISHLDFLHITRNIHVEDLEVYADTLLEKTFFHLMQNVLRYGEHATVVTLQYQERPDGLVLFVEDNGVGIPVEEKLMIFDRGHGKNTGLGLFFVREVLSITGITIRETGEPGKGARFEILVPRDYYRFVKGQTSL